MVHKSFFLERLQSRQHGSVGEVFAEVVANLRHGRGAPAPKAAHDFEFARREVNIIHRLGLGYGSFRSMCPAGAIVNWFFSSSGVERQC